MLSKILSDSYLLTYTDTPFRGYLKGLLLFDKQQISRDSNKPPKELIPFGGFISAASEIPFS
jgi:hypothetical protein